jgi:hypothetical protein
MKRGSFFECDKGFFSKLSSSNESNDAWMRALGEDLEVSEEGDLLSAGVLGQIEDFEGNLLVLIEFKEDLGL